jgi:membrane protease subunit HflC
MTTARWLALVVLIGLFAVLAARSLVIVDETQYVIVTEFGRPVRVYGESSGEAGPHAKWPWQSSLAIDRRVQLSEPPAREMITGDKRNVEVAPYVVWRVADPLRFLQAAGALESAAARLEERATAAVSNAVGRRPLAALATTDPEAWDLDGLAEEARLAVADAAREALGVEVLDLRLRRFNPPLEVRPAVFDLIRSERRQVAETLRADGEAQYRIAVSRAERARDARIAEADTEAAQARAEGEADATRTLNAAHAKDPEFALFLRTLDGYAALFDRQTTLVLSASSPLLRLLRDGPDPTPAPKPEESTPSPSGVAASAVPAEPSR